MKFLENLGLYILALVVVFLFLALCNWDFNPAEWNGFSRFLIGVVSLVGLKFFLNE